MICKSIIQTALAAAIAIGLFSGGYLTGNGQVSPRRDFDINNVPVVNPPRGKFPYFSLIEGYKPGRAMFGRNRDVPFDRYEFFDGTKINTVEGRLQTIIAAGNAASVYEILKTYEALVKDLGGVVVFEGDGGTMFKRGLEFKDKRGRSDALYKDLFGVYLIRTPDTEIWVEVYTMDQPGALFTGYNLTVVETKSLKIRATLLTAEQMKKELDSNGRVNLDIDFEDNKADIKPKSQAVIDETVKLMKNNPRMNLTVKGSSNRTGTRENNRKLSEARANSVVRALTARGIPASRLKAVGAGQDKETGDPRAAAGSSGVQLVKAN